MCTFDICVMGHLRSVKMVESVKHRLCDFLSATIVSKLIALSCTIFELLGVKKYRDL